MYQLSLVRFPLLCGEFCYRPRSTQGEKSRTRRGIISDKSLERVREFSIPTTRRTSTMGCFQYRADIGMGSCECPQRVVSGRSHIPCSRSSVLLTIQNLENKGNVGDSWENNLERRERMDLIETAQPQWMNLNVSDIRRLDEFFDHTGTGQLHCPTLPTGRLAATPWRDPNRCAHWRVCRLEIAPRPRYLPQSFYSSERRSVRTNPSVCCE